MWAWEGSCVVWVCWWELWFVVIGELEGLCCVYDGVVWLFFVWRVGAGVDVGGCAVAEDGRVFVGEEVVGGF